METDDLVAVAELSREAPAVLEPLSIEDRAYVRAIWEALSPKAIDWLIEQIGLLPTHTADGQDWLCDCDGDFDVPYEVRKLNCPHRRAGDAAVSRRDVIALIRRLEPASPKEN